VSEGGGFDSLRFQVFVEGLSLLDQTFVSPVAASAFFDDNVLGLGAWGSGLVGDLDVSFRYDLTASDPGDGFNVSFVGVVVPEPSSAALLGIGLLGLALRARSAAK
jgi:hypothetical protein